MLQFKYSNSLTQVYQLYSKNLKNHTEYLIVLKKKFIFNQII